MAALINSSVVWRVRKPSRKSFAQDHALLIEDEGARIGHALRLALGGLVADVVGIDRLALGVRQQGEGDLRLVGELLEDRRRIVADADDLDSRRPRSTSRSRCSWTNCVRQIRSPVGRAVEDQGDLALLEELVERALLALLVLER